ncbi:MAG TPA: DUF2249 domain-containing protein [Chloroflexota bacterium]|nr:DUF2249 domain-containing protein [Chloroflexota bacterium]
MTTAAQTDEPILASWRVSDVLRHYPALLDVLVGLSPAFAHLRNPLLRKVQTRLVTIAQAAQIAGLEPAALVRTLNVAAGLASAADPNAATEGQSPPTGTPAPHGAVIADHPPLAADLDIRPLLARGEEPFRAIMLAAASVEPGQALRLRAPFEPVPLYDVLGRRGFSHRAYQHAADGWEILFVKAGPGNAEALPPKPTTRAAAASTPATNDAEVVDAIVTIDVSDLVPPELMVRILEALDQLAPGQTLLVEHVRRPVFLYPRLDELGYLHETREVGPSRVQLRIHKPKGWCAS